ncbi:MAG: hypothetical protein ACM34H_01600 [Deltaproteobacteria bacterium]
MNAIVRKTLALALLILFLISFSGIASARKQGPVWQKGTVSKVAWSEGSKRYIGVDEDTYTFLPDDRVRIARMYKAPGGGWLSEKLSLDRVYVGTDVLIRVEGMVIHQLIVEEP